MAIEPLQTLEVIEALENFCARIRPPAHILPLLDIGYKVENQSVIVFEIRPRPNKSNEKMESLVAKTTFVKAKTIGRSFGGEPTSNGIFTLLMKM